ncbi:MAG: prolipoprotein diacylglyceryl transferase, partial [Opitutae bacterium]
MKTKSSNYWVHDLDPFLWQFPDSFSHWGPGGIRWYGIAYLAGFISAFFLLKHYNRRKRSPYDGEQIMNLMTFLVLGVLLGGRIGYALLYRWNEFMEDPLILLRVWEGGMASHGGFIGVCIAILWYARYSKQSPLPIGDLIVSVVPPGLFFGRIANFINGELWGRTTEVSWGILFPKAPGFLEGVARHPS